MEEILIGLVRETAVGKYQDGGNYDRDDDGEGGDGGGCYFNVP